MCKANQDIANLLPVSDMTEGSCCVKCDTECNASCCESCVDDEMAGNSLDFDENKSDFKENQFDSEGSLGIQSPDDNFDSTEEEFLYNTYCLFMDTYTEEAGHYCTNTSAQLKRLNMIIESYRFDDLPDDLRNKIERFGEAVLMEQDYRAKLMHNIAFKQCVKTLKEWGVF